MHVVHLIKTDVGATWAAAQIAVLTKVGVKVSAILPRRGPNFEAFDGSGANVVLGDFSLSRKVAPYRYSSMCSQFKHLIDQLDPDLIHSHFVGTTMFSRLALGKSGGPPRVFQVPGPLHLENVVTRQAEILTAGPRDYWIASSQATRKLYLSSGISKERLGLSYYGSPPRVFREGDATKLREVLGFGTGPVPMLIGMVAYAYPPKRWLGQRVGIKGHEDLIRATRILLNRNVGVHLVVIGGAWGNADRYYEGIKNYGVGLLGDKVSFLGNRSDVVDLYPGLDVAVHPSHSENLGGAPESLGQGVPTISTNVGGFPDLVINGETGWTVPPRSPEALADAIQDALGNQVEARRRANAGRFLAQSLFDVERTGREVVSFYEYMLERERYVSGKRWRRG